MYFVFLMEVLKRAFTPAPRVTDMLQILAASALPAVSTFAGIKLPQDAGASVFAYIGLVAISFVVIRLFWAPYSMWKGQVSEIGELKLELTKPQRMIMEHLALHRARARAKLAGLLENFQSLAFTEEWSDYSTQRAASQMTKIRKIEAQAGLCKAYSDLRGRLLVVVKKEGSRPNATLPLDRDSSTFLKLLQSYLIGDLTAEDLALQLPSYTELEKQP